MCVECLLFKFMFKTILIKRCVTIICFINNIFDFMFCVGIGSLYFIIISVFANNNFGGNLCR